MAALAAAFVVVGLSDDDQPSNAILAAEAVLTVVFILEFGLRFAASHDRRAYLAGHWIDILAIVPAVRGARLLRLLRLLRLVRTFAGVYRAMASLERMARHRGLIALFLAWLAVAAICAAALYLAEVGINPDVASPLDALWWGITTLTTVGYGDVYPITPEGRLAGAALMLLGITLFATITGTITSILVAGGGGEHDLITRLERLQQLHATGGLTDEEYAEVKARLLAPPSGRAAKVA